MLEHRSPACAEQDPFSRQLERVGDEVQVGSPRPPSDASREFCNPVHQLLCLLEGLSCECVILHKERVLLLGTTDVRKSPIFKCECVSNLAKLTKYICKLFNIYSAP